MRLHQMINILRLNSQLFKEFPMGSAAVTEWIIISIKMEWLLWKRRSGWYLSKMS